MAAITGLVLDVLKPHQPNAVDFALGVAARAPECQVSLEVTAVDEKTENVQISIQGPAIDFERVREAIGEMGGSIHSIDAVDVHAASTRKSGAAKA